MAEPMLPDISDIDPGFGHWFAGFTDGEACFHIYRKHKTGYACCFQIALRSDDGPILQEVRDRLGVGWLDLESQPPGLKAKGFKRAVYRVSDKQGLLKLIALFDAYPLRAKKRHDFALFREAVFEWTKVTRGCRDADWSRIGGLMTELREGRKTTAMAA